MSRSLDAKLAQLEAQAIHRISEMSDKQLAAYGDKLIAMNPEVELRHRRSPTAFAAMTDREIVGYALRQGWID